MRDVCFRKADPGDIERMAELDAVCFSAPWTKQAFEREIYENSLARYLVCETGGDFAGYAGLWVIVDEGHITNVAVHPDFRRFGVGAALLAALMDWTEKEDLLRNFTLEARVSNEIAICMYEKAGFVSCGLRKGYYADTADTKEDALIMWRSCRA
ncbi:MAG: ribosomal protein S18-alanine N-acetyltransferase [Clostridiales Family XIII bacterium]|jgi:ribosomal-protein-alanine N-acetyltransferase|nr:ribosomal protein S18-alanine N-acetyltransferase [Clostridiales Family XIII bacterium]